MIHSVRFGRIAPFLIATLSATAAMAQTSTSITLAITVGADGSAATNTFTLGQTGYVSSLGPAALVMTSSSAPIGTNGITEPVDLTFELAFNEANKISIAYTLSDPNFSSPGVITMAGGRITGGTGAYADASGSLDLTITKDAASALWTTSGTTGTGTLIVGSKTTPLILTGFHGWCCGWATRERDVSTTPFTVTGTLGSGTGTLNSYYYFSTGVVSGGGKITFNDTDSLTFGYGYNLTSSTSIIAPPTFGGSVHGGTGKYANAAGTLAFSSNLKGFGVTGTITTTPGAEITQVKTIYGSPQVSLNTWLEVHGHNLVPADTPAAGVDWSSASSFANGQMPTQLGPMSVNFAPSGGTGIPGYVYWYCSAQTNPNCAEDQINVLAPLLSNNNASPMRVIVNRNGATVAGTSVFRAELSPAFLSFDATGHIAARHVDASLVGPASLYPGLTTPAKPGEIISLYATGFTQSGAGITAGSATQSAVLSNAGLSCWVSGLNAPAVLALVSPGLYQINLTVPKGLSSGDNPVVCLWSFYPTAPGALIAVQ